MVSNPNITIVGSYLSPYVRKVLVCLDLKGLAYQIDPIVPYFGNDSFSQISPLRRIPVLIDDQVTLSDSTVICEYLEERFPTPALLPSTPQHRAQARWLEEYADTRMGEVFIWHLYNQLIIKKYVWGQAPDQAILKAAYEQEIPSVLDYLDTVVPNSGFIFEQLSIADISICSFFRNAAFARFSIDGNKWPKTKNFVESVLQLPSFTQLQAFEQVCLTTPINQHRDALKQAGAPIAPDTYFTDAPRPGILST